VCGHIWEFIGQNPKTVQGQADERYNRQHLNYLLRQIQSWL